MEIATWRFPNRYFRECFLTVMRGKQTFMRGTGMVMRANSRFMLDLIIIRLSWCYSCIRKTPKKSPLLFNRATGILSIDADQVFLDEAFCRLLHTRLAIGIEHIARASDKIDAPIF